MTVRLAYNPPLVDQLTWRNLLKNNLYLGSYGYLPHWDPRQVGVEVDTRVIVQGYQRYVEWLIWYAAL